MKILGFDITRLQPSAQGAIPVLVLLVLIMMLVPLPAILLDVLFTFNIALSIIVLFTAINIKSFKDFVAFPTVLLLTTLLRLSLNVASTRIVLMEGYKGTDAAGKVIEAFGVFLIGGNFAVGIVIFIVITIINFVVITKGSGRVAEVSARFALDSMPGKQMAIDADLNAGLIQQEEAKSRRADVAQEADFFGSMDGASKFVRGDAMAGIMILVINLIGGLLIGVLQHNMDFGKALATFAALTIGDGLVAQIPALIISTAAGILVTRVATEDDFSGQVSKQFEANSSALGVVAGVLGILGVLPGMPHFIFLGFAALFGGLAYLAHQKINRQAKAAELAASQPAAVNQELEWKDVPIVEPLSLELAYRLIPLVDKGDESDLIKRIRAIRRKFVSQVGFLIPSVHIRDNLQLNAETYRILLYGAEVGRGQCLPDRLLAIQQSGSETLPGIEVKDPTFGMPAVWIDRKLRDEAIAKGYTVVEPAVVITTHLDHLIHQHAAELLGRQETQDLIDHFKMSYPKLVEDVIPKVVSLAQLQRLLQLLLDESIPIKDMRTILEVASEHAAKLNDPLEVLSHIRYALRRTIVQDSLGEGSSFQVLGIQPEFERLIEQSIGQGAIAPDGLIEPSLARMFGEEVISGVQELESQNLPPVIVSGTRTRMTLSRIARRVCPQAIVLALSELPPTSNLEFYKVLCAQTGKNP
ncbi:MAG: flagellar biosynthesis protein FlhA [Rhodoferax sp.]|uniref:flagellar biosynthesis protein FlhA n=1 Tax=Polynucleobacter sp. MG-Unter2-18 TaxID=2081052 RepID=UPI001BFD4AEF|nr:flagellar biosynthesis protein FlhA [Polynucleobacter sp. MG-Unter2-18]MCF8165443.1 flagellar biosynthesis protein FlhA [Rhodoferax sp.]QWD94961.1 flagellar biosynthesis protein FlhA [Polynucleobacter sp. MG-Unter2-18]